jgi:hypothetical protein
LSAERPSSSNRHGTTRRILRPGDDPTFRGTTFGEGGGMLEFHVDEAAEFIRLFDIVWLS